MKAVDIIESMVYDMTLADKALVVEYNTYGGTYPLREWLADMFDAKALRCGGIKEGKYLVVYEASRDSIYPFQHKYEPEFVLERNNKEEYPEGDREIWLWRIE